jgi:predicted HicB family RNase H-like nuclease
MMLRDLDGWKAEHAHRTQRLRCLARRRPTPEAAPRPRTPAREDLTMDTHSAAARFEAALSQQLAMAGDPAVEAAGRALQATLAPATRQLAMELAEQAANEVAAQLPDHEVDVVLREGEPSLVVRVPAERAGAHTSDEDLQARITLRLPPSLKAMIEESAGDMGDSVNSFVLKTLSARAARAGGVGRRVQGTVQT